jgi:cytochrome c peroxidase
MRHSFWFASLAAFALGSIGVGCAGEAAVGEAAVDDTAGKALADGASGRTAGDGAALEASPALVAEVRALLAERNITPTPPPPPVPDALYELGRALAFDKILSGNGDISCLTCHHPLVGSDDDRHLPLGVGGIGLGEQRTGGIMIPRNAPALFNLHEYTVMFWDGRVEPDGAGGFRTPAGAQLTPEMIAVFDYGVVSAQAMFPVTSREEMRGQPGENPIADVPDGDFQGIWQALMQRLGEIPEYVQMFEAAYPGTPFQDMTFAHAANAIAGFEVRAFAALDSPWERFVAGDDGALKNKELQGAKTFFEVGCAGCHRGRVFSNFRYQNTGLVQFGPGQGDGPTSHDDFGRARVTGDPAQRYAFRATPLVNVALTAPYGHGGQYTDLRQFVLHYSDPAAKLRDYDITEHVSDAALHGLQVANLDDIAASISPLALNMRFENKDAKDMVDFLETLTAESSLDLGALVPERVPSGLPVTD